MSHTPTQMVTRPSGKLDAQLKDRDCSHQARQNGTAKLHKLLPPPRPKPR